MVLSARFLILFVTLQNEFRVEAFNGQFTGVRLTSTPLSLRSQLFMAIPQLDRWKILPNGSLVGTVKYHEVIDDGDVITTSPVTNPEMARSQAVMETASGSKYKLMTPLKLTPTPQLVQPERNGVDQQKNNGFELNGFELNGFEFPSFNPFGRQTMPFQPNKKENDLWKNAVIKYKLTAATVGLDDEYLLAGKPAKSTSGKSRIWEAYRSDPDNDGLPADEPPVCIKTSTNLAAVSREYENYKRISLLSFTKGRFVKCIEFFPVAGYGKAFRNECALVLEMGSQDLKSFLIQRGYLEGSELKNAAVSAAQCVQALHSAGLVWTDLKTENFVVMPNGEVKGIDLESAMPFGDNPVDYSPEACPPEFAEAFLSGDGPYFQLAYSYDVWSLGMTLYELASGRGYFDGKNPAQITKILRDSEDAIPLVDFDCDEQLKDLIRQCLNRDPKQRPTMGQILLHPYFFQSSFQSALQSPLSMFGR
jgi:hypothetical protein